LVGKPRLFTSLKDNVYSLGIDLNIRRHELILLFTLYGGPAFEFRRMILGKEQIKQRSRHNFQHTR
jgi:hypothetical protein